MNLSKMIKKLRFIAGTIYMRLYKFERLIVIEKKLCDTHARAKAKILFDLKFVKHDQFPRIANKFIKLNIDVEEIFKDGQICAIAEINGALIHWTFIAFNEASVHEIEKKIRMDSNSAYVFAGYTSSEYRGLGIAPKVMEEILIYLYKRGIENVYAVIRKTNISSRRYVRKVGFREIGVITFIKICILKHYGFKEMTKKDKNLIIKLFKFS